MAQANIIIRAKDLASKSLKRVQERFKNLSGTVKGFAGVLVGGSVAAGFGKVISLASDLQETTGKFNVVFRGVEQSAELMAKELQESFGLSTIESKKALSSFQDILVPMGLARDEAADLSGEMARLAVDVASFNNALNEDVLRDFQSAIVGNTETVRKYGIAITAERVKQEAFETGITNTVRELTAQEKILARASLLFADTADAQGDFARTSESFANQLKITTAELENQVSELGTKFLPIATKALKIFRDIPTAIKILIPVLATFGLALTALGGPITIVLAGMTALGAGVAFYNIKQKEAEEQAKQVNKQLREQAEAAREANSALKDLAEGPALVLEGGKANIKELAKLTDEELKKAFENVPEEARKTVDKLISEVKRFRNESKKPPKPVTAEDKDTPFVLTPEESAQLEKDMAILKEANKIQADGERIGEEILRQKQELKDLNIAEKLRQENQEMAKQAIAVNLVSSGIQGVSNALVESAFQGESFAKTMKQVFIQLGKQLASLIIQMTIFNSLFPGAGAGAGFGGALGQSLGFFQSGRGQTRRVPGPSNQPMPAIVHGGETISRGGGGSVMINFNGVVGDPDAVATQIEDVLRDHEMKTGVSSAV